VPLRPSAEPAGAWETREIEGGKERGSWRCGRRGRSEREEEDRIS